jgi:hypothetical protein
VADGGTGVLVGAAFCVRAMAVMAADTVSTAAVWTAGAAVWTAGDEPPPHAPMSEARNRTEIKPIVARIASPQRFERGWV